LGPKKEYIYDCFKEHARFTILSTLHSHQKNASQAQVNQQTKTQLNWHSNFFDVLSKLSKAFSSPKSIEDDF
jgi:hypothetical protein